MPSIRTLVLAGAATFLFAGAAVAATSNLHTMSVDLPDGSVAKIRYAGDVAPKIEIQPVEMREAAQSDQFEAAMFPELIHFDRIAAMLDAQSQEMMTRIAAMEREAASAVAPGGLMVSDKLPAGTSVSYSFTSFSNGRTGCTQSVEWRSDGSGAAPKVTRASSGDCDAAAKGDKAVPASTPAAQPAAPAGTNAT